MKTKMYMIIAVAIVIIIGAALYFVIPRGPKVVGIKTFNAPDGSFSFQYPEY